MVPRGADSRRCEPLPKRLGSFPADFETAEAHDLDRAALAANSLGLTPIPLHHAELPYDALMALIEAAAAAVFEEPPNP